MKTLFTLISMLLISIAVFSGNNSFNGSKDSTEGNIHANHQIDSTKNTCAQSSFTSTINDLSEQEIQGLLLMREEEKLARDVYNYFSNNYAIQVFSNITLSEERHMSAVLSLLNHYGLEDPMLKESGKFSNIELQHLYDDFIKKGKTIEEALAVGAFIEEYDIKDLKNLMDQSKVEDINNIYSNLLRGSENHLRAFVRNIARYEVNYENQILSKDTFDAIITSPNNCHGNNNPNTVQKGKGNGSGMKKGQQQGMNSTNGKNCQGKCKE